MIDEKPPPVLNSRIKKNYQLKNLNATACLDLKFLPRGRANLANIGYAALCCLLKTVQKHENFHTYTILVSGNIIGLLVPYVYLYLIPFPPGRELHIYFLIEPPSSYFRTRDHANSEY